MPSWPTPQPPPTETTFEQAFDRDPIPTELYGTHLPDIGQQLGELAVVDEYMAALKQGAGLERRLRHAWSSVSVTPASPSRAQ
jgi:hypothetical protein